MYAPHAIAAASFAGLESFAAGDAVHASGFPLDYCIHDLRMVDVTFQDDPQVLVAHDRVVLVNILIGHAFLDHLDDLSQVKTETVCHEVG